MHPFQLMVAQGGRANSDVGDQSITTATLPTCARKTMLDVLSAQPPKVKQRERERETSRNKQVE